MKKKLLICGIVIALLLTVGGTVFYFTRDTGLSDEEKAKLLNKFYDLQEEEVTFEDYILDTKEFTEKVNDNSISYVKKLSEKSKDALSQNYIDVIISKDDYSMTSYYHGKDYITTSTISTETEEIIFVYWDENEENCEARYNIKKKRYEYEKGCNETNYDDELDNALDLIYDELDDIYGDEVLDGEESQVKPTQKVSDEEKYLEIAKETFASEQVGVFKGNQDSGLMGTGCCNPNEYSGTVSKNTLDYQLKYDAADYGPSEIKTVDLKLSLVDGQYTTNADDFEKDQPYTFTIIVDITSDKCKFDKNTMQLECEVSTYGEATIVEWQSEDAKDMYRHNVKYQFDEEDNLVKVSSVRKLLTYSDEISGKVTSDEEKAIYLEFVDSDITYNDLVYKYGADGFYSRVVNMRAFEEHYYTITY